MSEKPDYKSTVFLPVTDFPMKAGLPQKEPAILARWQADDLYAQVRAARSHTDNPFRIEVRDSAMPTRFHVV